MTIWAGKSLKMVSYLGYIQSDPYSYVGIEYVNESSFSFIFIVLSIFLSLLFKAEIGFANFSLLMHKQSSWSHFGVGFLAPTCTRDNKWP